MFKVVFLRLPLNDFEEYLEKTLTENTNGFGVLVWVVIVFVGVHKVIADRAPEHGPVVVPGHRVGGY